VRAKSTSLFILGMLFMAAAAGGGEMVDLALLNGIVWTGNPSLPWAEAVAVRGEKIHLVGPTAQVKSLVSPETIIIDLEGALVLPGFVDSHTHFLNGGFSLNSVQLRTAKTREDFVSRLQAKARELGPGRWVLNGDWDHEQFTPPGLPEKDWIDAVTPANPVCVNRLDGHMVLANSLALKLAGIARDTPPPPGGDIVKDPATGEPTGILKDAASDLVLAKVPEPAFAERLEAALIALRHAAEAGVTSIHEMADAVSLEVYQELLKTGKLTARLCVYIPITEVDAVARLKLKSPFGGDLLKIGGLKGFVDGSLGSATALFFEPYTDNPGTRGLLHGQMFPDGIMEKRVMDADRAGLQVAIHAIGDRANNLLLDIFEKVMRQNGARDRRWRIEHAQHLRPGDIGRFGTMGLIASVQPYHAADDGRWAEKKIGKDRARTTYAFRSLLSAGARLACGSDWTVAPLNPLTGIQAAVTRQTLDGKNPSGWIPEEKISLEEALFGYTINGAYAEFAEKVKGTIESGKFADLVVLDKNIFNLDPGKIREASVLYTVFNGSVIFEKPR
jgi:hypothetical protein